MPVGRAVSFDGPHGPVHAFDFPPTNPDVAAPADELPPYVVFVHGGPTAHVSGVADAKTAFFTSRGVGVLDVNYGGSTGYGRAYRERLREPVGRRRRRGRRGGGIRTRGRRTRRLAARDRGRVGGRMDGARCARRHRRVPRPASPATASAMPSALAEDTTTSNRATSTGSSGRCPRSGAALRGAVAARSPRAVPRAGAAPSGSGGRGRPARAVGSDPRCARRAWCAARLRVGREGEHGFRRAGAIVHALESELAFLGAVFGFDTPGIPPITLS